MCDGPLTGLTGGKAEWKDRRGQNRWTEELRDRANTVYDSVDTAKADKLAAFDTEAAKTTSADLQTAYQDEHAGDLQGAYTSALNEIKEGFVRRGIFDQTAFGEQQQGLDTAHTGTGGQTGQGRLDALAAAYGSDVQGATATQRAELAASLNTLQSQAEKPEDTSDLHWEFKGNYDPKKNPYYNKAWEAKVGEMGGLTWDEQKGVTSGTRPEFLQDYEKLHLNNVRRPQIRSTTTPSARKDGQGGTLTNSMGLRTPYSGSSQSLIR